jgi:hypothetical protein
MKTHAIVVLTALGWTSAIGGTAHAQYISSGAASCQPISSSDASRVYYGSSVSNNSKTSSANVACPLNIGRYASATLPLGSFVTRYVDGTSTDLFSCFWLFASNVGAGYMSKTKYTCSTAGGCSDPTTSYVGTGNYLLWQGTDLGSVTGTAVDGSLVMICTIPRCNNCSYISGLISYYAW